MGGGLEADSNRIVLLFMIHARLRLPWDLWLACWHGFSWIVAHVVSLFSVLLLQQRWRRKRLVFWWLRRVVLFASNLLTSCAIWTRSDTHSIQSPYVRMAGNNSNWGEPKWAPHWSWQQPTYISNIFTRVCCTLVPEIRVRPKIFHVFWYYWRAHVHDLQLNSRDQRRLVTLLKLYRTHIPDDVSTYSFART